jgi:hypothetical protein
MLVKKEIAKQGLVDLDNERTHMLEDHEKDT